TAEGSAANTPEAPAPVTPTETAAVAFTPREFTALSTKSELSVTFTSALPCAAFLVSIAMPPTWVRVMVVASWVDQARWVIAPEATVEGVAANESMVGAAGSGSSFGVLLQAAREKIARARVSWVFIAVLIRAKA